jgi:hypothetical protein
MSLSGSGFGDGSPTRFDGGFDSSPGSFLCPLSCVIIERKTANEAAAFLELMSDTEPAKRGSWRKNLLAQTNFNCSVSIRAICRHLAIGKQQKRRLRD